MNQSKIRLFAAAIVLFGSALTAFSQAAIKTGDGFLFIKNDVKKSFIIEIKGKEVKTLESANPMFLVDGKILQIIMVPLTNFAPKNINKTDMELLEMHKNWESGYLSDEVFKRKLTVESEKFSVGDRKALFWGFIRPSFNQEVDGDYFLTTIIGDNLIGIGSSISPKDKKETIRVFLNEVFKTLQVSDRNFDIEKMSKEIKEKPADR